MEAQAEKKSIKKSGNSKRYRRGGQLLTHEQILLGYRTGTPCRRRILNDKINLKQKAHV